jgi:hypothetical protein
MTFMTEHKDISCEWYSKSNYLGLLSVRDEYDLHELVRRAYRFGVRYSVFREPDIGDKITAIALEPGPKSKKLCAKLTLALRE